MDRTPTAVIVAPGDDLHARAVARRIAQLYGGDARCVVFDPATYPIASTIEMSWRGGRSCVQLHAATPLGGALGPGTSKLLATTPRETTTVAIEAVAGVWWRRARAVQTHTDVDRDQVQRFCARSATETMRALFALVPTHNDLDAEFRADRKPYQLQIAREVGLAIPDTLVTTDPAAARAFIEDRWDAGDDVVYKHAASGAATGFPTRLVTRDDLERLHTVRFAPTIFQQRIRGGVDLRVVAIGQQVFAAEWRREGEAAELVDIRLDGAARMWPGQCPDPLRDRLVELNTRMNLSFGVYDLKLDDAGTPHFLEVNPSGQWLDIELGAAHPISEAWARLLVEGEASACRSPYSPDEVTRFAAAAQAPEAASAWRVVP